jgi:phage baseplate assembly protein W|tara:strand:+ start:264 stop:644 length:381 start_codon:yes stop_codon:yes gene_type:complete
MYGIGAKLPLSVDNVDGHFVLIKTLVDEIKQNLFHLIMTSPGERIMDIDFGVGIRNFLFEQMVSQTEGRIESRILSQVGKYIPFIVINDIRFDSNDYENLLGIAIVYRIPNLGKSDTLRLDFAENN